MDNKPVKRQDEHFSPNVNVWLKVKADIEIKIITDEFPSGMKLPSTVKIADMYGIGNSTAKKVLESLCDDGVLVIQRGVGHFVKPFVKDRLLKIHGDELHTRLTETIKYGKEIGFDDTAILNIVNRVLAEINNG